MKNNTQRTMSKAIRKIAMLSMLLLTVMVPHTMQSQDLITATTLNDLTTVKRLLEHGADVNTQWHNGVTALMIAADHGQLAIVQELINHHANTNLQSNRGLTALMFATDADHLAVVQKLIECHANVNLKTNGRNNGETALMIAIDNNNEAIAHELIHHGSDVNLQNNRGITALMIAAQNNHLALAQTLIEHHADINLQTIIGSTALMIAAQNNYLAMVQKLIEHDANVNLQTTIGSTALMSAAEMGHLAIAQELIAHGAHVRIQGHNGTTALMLASANHHLPVVQELTKHYTPHEIIDMMAATFSILKRDISHILIQAGFTIPAEVRQSAFIEIPDRSEQICSICRAPLDDSEAVIPQETATLKCHHESHRECLNLWLAQKRECPECRTPVTNNPIAQEDIDASFRALVIRLKNNPFTALPSNDSEPRFNFERDFLLLPFYQREHLKAFQKTLINDVVRFYEAQPALDIMNQLPFQGLEILPE